MTDRLVPATLAIRDDGTLVSPEFGDIYHNVAGALAQANYVSVAGNRLPARWQGRRTFTIVETGFGTGANFLATWAAWREDPARCERLHFVSVEKHPFSRDDLRKALSHIVANTTMSAEAAMLADAWPTLVPGLHRLEFDDGRVVLTLAFGDAREMLPKPLHVPMRFIWTVLRRRKTRTCGRPTCSAHSDASLPKARPSRRIRVRAS